jgi:hypothetical protein
VGLQTAIAGRFGRLDGNGAGLADLRRQAIAPIQSGRRRAGHVNQPDLQGRLGVNLAAGEDEFLGLAAGDQAEQPLGATP